MSILPPKRPAQESLATRTILANPKVVGSEALPVTQKLALLAVRGYFRDTMGEWGGNDFGIYDDAMFIHSPVLHQAFNANTDPSVHEKGIAVLKEGVWMYRQGIHGLSRPPEKRYPALVQAGVVTVAREGGPEETGFFGINCHRGGEETTTGSRGCLTIPRSQWDEFFSVVKQQMELWKQATIPILLVKYPGGSVKI